MTEVATGKIPVMPVPMKISQICVVVADIDDAMERYTKTLGWGPWNVYHYEPPLLHDTMVRGERMDFQMIGAETFVDGFCFELIQPVSGPSIYQEHLDKFGESIQHVAIMQHSWEDSAAFKEHWAHQGVDILMYGKIGDSIEFYYLDTAPMIGFVLESGSGHAIEMKPTRVYP